jgi:hypothetical protein
MGAKKLYVVSDHEKPLGKILARKRVLAAIGR